MRLVVKALMLAVYLIGITSVVQQWLKPTGSVSRPALVAIGLINILLGLAVVWL